MSRIGELALISFKLGVLGFGGPAAHIAMLEDEVVKRREWITPERFLDMMGATNLIPGPNSTEMVLHVGFLRAGWLGLLVAGTCFILPAVAIVFRPEFPEKWGFMWVLAFAIFMSCKWLTWVRAWSEAAWEVSAARWDTCSCGLAWTQIRSWVMVSLSASRSPANGWRRDSNCCSVSASWGGWFRWLAKPDPSLPVGAVC